jgi:hypothetical protein
VPLHDDVQHGGEEPAVPPRLVLRAAGHRVRDVAERPVNRIEPITFLHWYQCVSMASVVDPDPDPVGSGTFCRIRIRIRIRNK